MEYYNVIKAKSVEDDLEEIANYIAEDNPYRAISFTQEILRDAENTLNHFPKKLQRYKDCHMWPYKGYLVFYDINEISKTVEIIMVTHASQYNKYKHLISH